MTTFPPHRTGSKPMGSPKDTRPSRKPISPRDPFAFKSKKITDIVQTTKTDNIKGCCCGRQAARRREPGRHHTTAGRGPIASRHEPGRHHTTAGTGSQASPRDERKATAADWQPDQNTVDAPLHVCRTPVRPARDNDDKPACHPRATWAAQQQRKWRHRQRQRQWRHLGYHHRRRGRPMLRGNGLVAVSPRQRTTIIRSFFSGTFLGHLFWALFV